MTIIIFGASGDLTQRKLVPALYNLYRKGRLAAGTQIVGYARRPYDDETFRSMMREGAEQFSGAFDAQIWDAFAPSLPYFQGNLDVKEDYPKLQAYLQQSENCMADRLYYVATSPDANSVTQATGAHQFAVGVGGSEFEIRRATESRRHLPEKLGEEEISQCQATDNECDASQPLFPHWNRHVHTKLLKAISVVA